MIVADIIFVKTSEGEYLDKAKLHFLSRKDRIN